MKKPLYFDYHATTPVDKRVLEKMIPYFSEKFGNVSSIDHKHGNEIKKELYESRESIANLINADPEEIIFTSGATESDNLAIKGIAELSEGKHIITCKTEHKAVLDVCKFLESKGFEITYLNVDNQGFVNIKELEESIRDDTALISIMTSNNEIGTIAPIEKIGKIAKKNDILFHTDAAQAYGHIDIDVKKNNIDLLSLSGHKIYGPKGIGALYVRRTLTLAPQIHGGGHERKMRSGTLNMPGIIGLRYASEYAKAEMKDNRMKIHGLRNKLYSIISEETDVEINGPPNESKSKLAHNLSLCFEGVEAKAILNDIKDDISISAGSACTTNDVKPSHVILALGYDEDRAYQTVRIGLGPEHNEEMIEFCAETLVKSVNNLKTII